MGRAPLVLIAVLVLCATLAGCSASKPAQGADLHDTIESAADDLGAPGMAVEVDRTPAPHDTWFSSA
ncbi:hypothetical protein ACHIPZ_04715 [Antrihabitans sp. NCIMB 15449]|jgi:ABC-type glycerol-3-phosphate transport system substrate-binding protein